mmetsp:Transcript_67911/g.162150  ORF Transcript_67911/g.162150 Transcript_67911/m.162150 type:complete len:182 (+) Transcript_67911:118-663(+)|eukprot:CAMPEP_0180324272 /NCGR_PEP_ID=MMETSP0988-20121125/37763_1 /TAXON_ID=697907 /ORGANISM="non described non described, Strain CCMP2293" /LENGTH=181 /DNA_ID=CAMNT_0022310545 /DNA_START=44 /DNA_END=589 /DNA_ORIENTATION=-
MDIYTQLQEKLDDMSHRITHEARYFQEVLPSDLTAKESRLPLLEGNFVETRASLAVRAQVSAESMVALNLQVDNLLATLPSEEGEEAAQQAILEALVADNRIAGDKLQEETDSAERMLIQVRGAIKEMGDDRSRDSIEQLSLQRDMAARGLVSHQLAADPYAHIFMGGEAGAELIGSGGPA